MGIVEERRKLREELLKRASNYAKGLEEKFGEVAAVAYGSVARGDFNVWSDVDLIVVAKSMPKDVLRRQEELYLLAPPRLEPKGYTLEELEEMVERNHPFLEVLRREGILLKDGLGVEKLLGLRRRISSDEGAEDIRAALRL